MIRSGLNTGRHRLRAKTFFEIPMASSRKPLETIASKKRAMYRRRYELLDDTFTRIDQVLKGSYAVN